MSVPRRDKDSRRSVDNYLPKMGKALGWSREDTEINDKPVTFAIKESADKMETVDAIREPGEGHVKVKPKAVTPLSSPTTPSPALSAVKRPNKEFKGKTTRYIG